MKTENMMEAARLLQLRSQLTDERSTVRLDMFDCTIAGTYQKSSMAPRHVDALKALLLEHINRRIEDIDGHLKIHGIKVED